MVVLDIEMEGVKQVKKSNIQARYVFVAPPSEGELEKRLRGRGTETEDSIGQRLTQAQKELEFAKVGGFDKIIINDNLDKAIRELEGWVYTSTA